MRLVLCVGWPCALAAVIAVAGVGLSDDGVTAGRRLSTTMYAKYEALSVCVQSVTGEEREAEDSLHVAMVRRAAARWGSTTCACGHAFR